MIDVYLGLGSNLGDRPGHLAKALAGLAATPGVEVVAAAEPVETGPVGGPAGQGNYLNSVSHIRTSLEPLALLEELHRLERLGGRCREREERWGPRTIDLDILLWGDDVVSLPGLTIPHPRLAERLFVLEPLARLNPEVRHPATGLTAREMLERMKSQR